MRVRHRLGYGSRMPGLDDDLALALRLARLAADVALPYVGRSLDSWVKPDGSMVGEADLAVERALLDVLRAERPDDAILSEEAGTIGADARRWVLDPLDGTSMFLYGETGWGTHIALEVDGEIVVGVITRPLDDRLWWAVRGGGAFTGRLSTDDPGRPIHVSAVSSIDDATLTAWQPSPRREVAALRATPGWVRATPDAYLHLAEGALDAVLSLGGLFWDHAPTVLIVEEAGGRFRDRAGGRRLDLQGGVYSNGHLDEAIGALVGWY
jgi:histidinol-phosphatase